MNAWSPVLAAHLPAVAAWAGGTFHAPAVPRPSFAALDPPQRMALHPQAFRRFLLVVWHAMPMAPLSGYAMPFGVYGGFHRAHWSLHVMHGTGPVMAGVFAAVVFGPYAALRRRPGPAPLDRIRRLVTLNPALGAPTIAVASFGHRG